MNKTCFCGIAEHCGYQIETDMEQHDKVIYEKGYNKAIDEAINKAISIANQLAEEYNNGWILCSDRLPDFLDNVLVCTKSGGRTIAHLKHTPIEWRDMHMNKIDDVIAWKYLDAPYQPKGE